MTHRGPFQPLPFCEREKLAHAHSESSPSASPRLAPELRHWPRVCGSPTPPRRPSPPSHAGAVTCSCLRCVPARLLAGAVNYPPLLHAPVPASLSSRDEAAPLEIRRTAFSRGGREPRGGHVLRSWEERCQVLLNETGCPDRLGATQGVLGRSNPCPPLRRVQRGGGWSLRPSSYRWDERARPQVASGEV